MRACGPGNICAIVYQEFCSTAVRNLGGLPDEFIQYFGCEIFFADLNEIDFGCGRGFDKLQDPLEVFTAGCRRCRRLALGDEVADWLLRTVHFSYRCSHRPVAARRRFV